MRIEARGSLEVVELYEHLFRITNPESLFVCCIDRIKELPHISTDSRQVAVKDLC